MNLTELARKLKVTTKELKEKLPELGFHIGGRAIQIPDEQAQGVIEKWQEMLAQEELKKKEETLRQRDEASPEKAKSERVARLPQIITVHRLAERLGLSVIKIISELLKQGVVATINDNLDYEIAAIIAETLGWRAEKEKGGGEEAEKTSIKEKIKNLLGEENKKDLVARPPVVVVMGHIDHGKTSLLDRIRQTNVAAKEAGAITQHIGAYQVEIKDKEYGRRKITFIDTPGHEAFNEMRSHGGQVADIAILVIAADDKVQPQTLESIKVIQESNLPFIVAINKIDRPEVDIDRIKKGLSEVNIAPEDWGGKTICVPISAKTGEGVDNLLKMVILVADLEKDKLLTNPNREALGVVIESHVDKGAGTVATVIVYAGTLHSRDNIIIGQAHGKIRSLKNYLDEYVEIAEPGTPVQILGLKTPAHIGDILEVVDDVKDFKKRAKGLNPAHNFAINQSAVVKEKKQTSVALNVVLKADVSGSLEAIATALEKLNINPEVKLKLIKKGLGDITDTDFNLAKSSGAWLVGFHVDINSTVKGLAEETGYPFYLYQVIYQLIDEAQKQMNGLLKPEVVECPVGRAKVLALFRKSGNQQVVGVRINEGQAVKGAKIRVWRTDKLIGEGSLVQLQINKENVSEARTDVECGIRFDGHITLQVDDVLEIYSEEKKERKIFT